MNKIIKSFIAVLIFLSATALLGCDAGASNSNSVKATPTPTPTEEEKKQKRESEEKEKEKAITDFINKNYAGWSFGGLSGEVGVCDVDFSDTCDLLINKGQQEKIIQIKIKTFTDFNGQSKMTVFELRPSDISKNKADANKRKILEDMSADDVPEVVKTAIIEAHDDELAEAAADYEPPEPY